MNKTIITINYLNYSNLQQTSRTNTNFILYGLQILGFQKLLW